MTASPSVRQVAAALATDVESRDLFGELASVKAEATRVYLCARGLIAAFPAVLVDDDRPNRTAAAAGGDGLDRRPQAMPGAQQVADASRRQEPRFTDAELRELFGKLTVIESVAKRLYLRAGRLTDLAWASIAQADPPRTTRDEAWREHAHMYTRLGTVGAIVAAVGWRFLARDQAAPLPPVGIVIAAVSGVTVGCWIVALVGYLLSLRGRSRMKRSRGFGNGRPVFRP